MSNTLNINQLLVLVAPLDWGLGHTTRCIPIIRGLSARGCRVIAAGNPGQGRLIREEFPDISFLNLQGYNIRYGRSSFGTVAKLMWQLPKINRAIRREHQWLNEQLSALPLDAIISDNRYGLYADHIPSILVTHQLQIKTPFGLPGDRLASRLNNSLIRRFTECWVPDYNSVSSFAGALSQSPKKLKTVIRHIGPLSRLRKIDRDVVRNKLLIILSGPEPQRSILENSLIDQLATGHFKATVVRGIPDAHSQVPSTNDIHFYNHLPAARLNEEMQESEFVISRCGYSTIMDLAALEKKSILLPTGGQTEQQYLARHLQNRRFAFCADSANFNLQKAVEQARLYDYQIPQSGSGESLEGALDDFVSGLKKG
jgi:uncharacterized protein (TIGR00661 family)